MIKTQASGEAPKGAEFEMFFLFSALMFLDKACFYIKTRFLESLRVFMSWVFWVLKGGKSCFQAACA